MALPTRPPPPMKTMRPIVANAAGYVRSSSARLVSGASGTRVTAPAAAAASRASRSSSTARARVRSQGGGRHPEVAHAVVAVHVAARRPAPRAAAARHRRDGHVAAAGGLEHGEGVAHDVGQRARCRRRRSPRAGRGPGAARRGAGRRRRRHPVSTSRTTGRAGMGRSCRMPATEHERSRAENTPSAHGDPRRACSTEPDRARPRHSAGWRGVTYRRQVLSATPRPLATRRLAATTCALLALAARRVRGRPGRPPVDHDHPLDRAVEHRPEHGIRLALGHPGRRRGLRVDDVRRPDPRPAARAAAHGRLRRQRTRSGRSTTWSATRTSATSSTSAGGTAPTR